MDAYRVRAPKPANRVIGYRLALLLILIGVGIEAGGIFNQDVWFAFSGLVIIALGAIIAYKSAWRAKGA